MAVLCLVRLLVLVTAALLWPSVEAYKLSPVDGTANIGAYHVQPGRCANVERTLGRRYYYFFRQSIPHMPTPQMDSTALCADDPQLTQGYSGNFVDKPYLMYARCLYGRNTIRALCGTTDRGGKPTQIVSPVEATCPKYTRCKNLCATKVNNALGTAYEPVQVQLAQCMPFDMYDNLTRLYAPKSPSRRPNTPGVSFTADDPISDNGQQHLKDTASADPSIDPASAATAGYGPAGQVHSLSNDINAANVQASLTAMGFRKRSISRNTSSHLSHRHASHARDTGQ